MSDIANTEFTSDHLNQDLKIIDMHNGEKTLPLKIWLDGHAKYKIYYDFSLRSIGLNKYFEYDNDINYRNEVTNGNMYENLVCELYLLVEVVNQSKNKPLSEKYKTRLNNLNELEVIIYNQQCENFRQKVDKKNEAAAATRDQGLINLIILIIIISAVVKCSGSNSDHYIEEYETPSYRK